MTFLCFPWGKGPKRPPEDPPITRIEFPKIVNEPKPEIHFKIVPAITLNGDCIWHLQELAAMCLYGTKWYYKTIASNSSREALKAAIKHLDQPKE